MSDIDTEEINTRPPWEPGSDAHEKALSVPVQYMGWLGLYSDILCDLLYVSPDAQFFEANAQHGRILIECQYVPRPDEPNPDKMFDVFCSLLNLAEIRSESVCQFCGRLAQRYVESMFEAYALCPTHAVEKGFIDPSSTEIVR